MFHILRIETSLFLSSDMLFEFSMVVSFLTPLSRGGDEGVRTPDPLRARQVLSQLSYTPIDKGSIFHLLMICSLTFVFERTLKIKQC